MFQAQAIQKYTDLLAGETGKVKKDIHLIRKRLDFLTDQLKSSSAEHEKLDRKMAAVRKSQDRFQERVKMIAEKIALCKSLLASPHS